MADDWWPQQVGDLCAKSPGLFFPNRRVEKNCRQLFWRGASNAPAQAEPSFASQDAAVQVSSHAPANAPPPVRRVPLPRRHALTRTYTCSAFHLQERRYSVSCSLTRVYAPFLFVKKEFSFFYIFFLIPFFLLCAVECAKVCAHECFSDGWKRLIFNAFSVCFLVCRIVLFLVPSLCAVTTYFS